MKRYLKGQSHFVAPASPYGGRIRYIAGPDGRVITIADLPSPRGTRWVFRRKAAVVFAVRGGLLDLDEACKRYRLTVEEFNSWRWAIESQEAFSLNKSRSRQKITTRN